MLETVRSRRIYGASILLILPACVLTGYYLRTREDERIAQSASLASSSLSTSSSSPSPSPAPAPSVDEKAVRERIAALRRREEQLEMEAGELRGKLERARERAREQRAD
ncbi:hypothetical protein JCM8547_001508 [Rhodosporidiobolus lusitaniae]